MSSGEKAEENRRHYTTIVKRIKKEIGDKHNQSIKLMRQLLPLPKQFDEAIVTEQFGLVPDSKGQKVRGFNCDKKQGLQVAEKQKISPWDILEGFKNPAPLSWHWFQGVKTERKALKYEESHTAVKYLKNSFIKSSSHYTDPPPLPQEDLEPNKDAKDEDKNDPNKMKMDEMIDPINGMVGKRSQMAMGMGMGMGMGIGMGMGMGMQGNRMGNPRMMTPTGGPMGSGPMGPNMMPPNGQNMYSGQGGPNYYPNNNMGGSGNDYMNYNNGAATGPTNSGMGPMGPGNNPQMNQQQMGGYNNSMGYGGMNTGNVGPNNTMMGAGPQMQNMPGSRFPSQGMSGAKQAVQNLIRSRTTVGPPVGQYGGPPQQQMTSMMRPSGGPGGSSQYPGNMMPTGGQGMSMNRPMYSGGGGTMMNPNYGMQGGYGGGYGGNPGMRMSSQGHMRPSGGYMSGPMQGGMGMSAMGMPRSGMMPSSGYNMHGSGPMQGSYSMQGNMGMSGPMGSRPGMMPPGMRMGGPGMMSNMSGGSAGMMQSQGGMMQGQGGMMHSGAGGMGGMPGQSSQLMAHLQRGGGMQGQQGGMPGYQGNRY